MEDVREVVVRWKKNKLCMREACLPRKRRERERVIYSLRARLENVYPRGCRGVNAITFREMDLIALIIFNGRWEWKEKVHVENVERSTGIIEEGGGGGFRKNRDKLHSFGIDCLSNRYRTVAQSFGNPRSFAAYVLYYVSKGKECPYQISPGVRWMHGRVDNEYIYICIREIECRAYYGATRFLSVIDSGRNWVELGRDLFLALDSERLCVPFA